MSPAKLEQKRKGKAVSQPVQPVSAELAVGGLALVPPPVARLDPNVRLALYGSVALAVLTFTATNRLFDAGGGGVLAWFGLLALASYGLFWTWTRYHKMT